MTPIENYNNLLSAKIIKELDKRNIEGFYCENKKHALSKALSLISEQCTVSCGGSQTLQEIGIIDAFRNGNYTFLDPHAPIGALEKDKVAHQALEADYYLMSANAITENGEIVNADGYGNRVASLIFGPKHVIIIAGMNKVVPTLESAVLRVNTIASRMISLKFSEDFNSFEMLSEKSEYNNSHLVITSRTAMKGRIQLILVGENLGF